MYSVMLLPSNCALEIASWTTVLLEPPLFMTPFYMSMVMPRLPRQPITRTRSQAQDGQSSRAGPWPRINTLCRQMGAHKSQHTHKESKKTGCATISDNEPLAQPYEYEGVLYHTAHHHIIFHVSDNHLLNMQCQLWGSNPRAVACSGS